MVKVLIIGFTNEAVIGVDKKVRDLLKGVKQSNKLRNYNHTLIFLVNQYYDKLRLEKKMEGE